MIQYKYRTAGDFEEVQELGKAGWKLVSVTFDKDTLAMQFIMEFTDDRFA